MQKKGISPLIATVLLVAFSIALAAIVSTYVVQKTKEFKPEAIIEDTLLCDEVYLDYRIDADEDGYTLSYEQVSANLEIYKLKGLKIVNKGAFSIHKYVINSPGLETSEQFLTQNNARKELIPGEERELEIGLRNDPNDKLIKITPIIKDPEKEVFVKCSKRQLIFDHERLCNDVGCTLIPLIAI